jgi:hypothetical protein
MLMKFLTLSPQRKLCQHLDPTVSLPSHHKRVDITRYIKFKLDHAAGNYNKWKSLFLSVLTKYNARDHVE